MKGGGRSVRVRGGFEDAELLALKLEKEAKRMLEASRRWKRKGNGSSSRASRRNATCPQVDFSPVDPISGFCFLEPEENKFALF